MKNSCREKDPDGKIEFTVTEDHVRLLKRLNMKTATFVSDESECGSYFQNCPAVDAKRPFGNSGEPAWCALEAAGVEPRGTDGDYGPDQLSYGQYLILSLPMAYEAVMAYSFVEPCTVKIDWYGGACSSFRHKRVLEFWREAVDAACAVDGVSSHQLVTLLMNAGKSGTPMGPLVEIRNMMSHCAWMRAALDAMKPFAVRKYRLANPDTGHISDDGIWDGLLSGRYVLAWPYGIS